MQFRRLKNKKLIAIALTTFIFSSNLAELSARAENTNYSEGDSTGYSQSIVEEEVLEDESVKSNENSASNVNDDKEVTEMNSINDVNNAGSETTNLEVVVDNKAVKTASKSFTGFVKENGKWQFYLNNVQKKGWINYGGNKYYIINNYTLPQNMWREINGKKYYFNKDGVMIKSQIVKIDGKEYKFNSEGHLVTSGNISVSSTPTEEQNNLYKKGEQTLANSASNVKNGILNDAGKWYKYENGKRTRGWYQEGSNKYFFLNTLNRAENMWRTIQGKTYYFGKDGVMVSNSIKYIGGKTYKFNSDGTYDKNAVTSIVLKDVSARKQANNSSEIVNKFVKGNGIQVISTNGGFARVKSGDGKIDGWIPTSAFISASQEKVQNVINVAKSQIGKPYVWGGTGPNSFDCSGLMYYAFRNGTNISLPRVSKNQATVGTYVSRENLKPGDLIFWGSPIHHVALYIGNGQYIHAPEPGKTVTIAKLGSYTTARRVIQ